VAGKRRCIEFLSFIQCLVNVPATSDGILDRIDIVLANGSEHLIALRVVLGIVPVGMPRDVVELGEEGVSEV